MSKSKAKKKKKTVIREPSVRVVVWSALMAIALIVAMVTVGYGVGVWHSHAATASTHLPKDQKDKT